VFGEHASSLAVSSTKSAHGHLLGAAGALELVATIAALRERFLPATLHLRQPDPECDLDYVPNEPRRDARVDTFMSNSFAFGGSNAVLIARRFER
jgi:3-oxoacyl-(acyl-carrier-protein) synthase